MKNFISLFLFFTLTQKVQAQIVFCPAGAEWHFSFSEPEISAPNSYYNEKIKYVRDSLLGNETVKILSHNNLYSYCNFIGNFLTLIKQKGDTIFMKGASTGQTWQILYNYAALPGQSWTTTITTFYNFSQTITYTVTIDSIKYVTINSFPLKKLYVKFFYPNAPVESTDITERLGCSRYLFNYKNPASITGGFHCDLPYRFLCYEDSTFGLRQFSSFPCDYSNPLGIVQNYQRNSIIKIYPNPANNFFHISSENELTGVESLATITDLCGREIKQLNINHLDSESTTVEIDDLAQGVYILRISNNNELVYTGKLIKTE